MPRGRPKKEETISEEQVWDVIAFAKQMYNMYPNIFTPDLVNARLKDTTLNPLSGTETDIDNALKNPKDSEEQLIGFSQFFELTDMLYKRQILYLGNLPSFDLTYTCINAKNAKDYSSDAYKKDEKAIIDFLDKFDYYQEFNTVVKQLFRNETFFCQLRTDGDKYVLQELPRKFCKITGKFEYGLLFDFNMYWFIQPGVDISMYSPQFKKLYKNVFGKNGTKEYKPSLPIDSRNSTYIYWHQLSPIDGFWGWKLNPELISQVPFFSPLFPDLVLKPLVRKLQKNKFIIESSKVLVALLPMLKENKSGNVKDMLALDPDTAGKFANLVRQGLSKEIQFAMGPFSDMKSFEFKSDGHNMMDEYSKVTTGQSGTNARLLYATDKMNAEETRHSVSIDEQVAIAVYPHFANFMSFYANKNTKKFKFKFTFEGTNMPSNREKRLNDAMTLAEVGVVLPQKISAAIGMSYPDFKRQLEMARAEGFVDALTPLQTSYTMTNKDTGGRPRSNQPSDSADQTRTDGTNIDKGGDI